MVWFQGTFVHFRGDLGKSLRIFAMTKRPVEPPDAAERRKAKAVIAYRVDLLPKFDATGRSSAMDGPLRMWLEPGGCLPSYYNIKSNPDLGDQR